MPVNTDTRKAIEAAVAYVRRISEAHADDTADPVLFTIRYACAPGIGSGGLTGASRAFAMRYLHELVTDNLLIRHHGLRYVEVTAVVPAVTFVA